MKRVPFVLALAFLLCAPFGFATSAPIFDITYAKISISVNGGTGNNANFTLGGTGTSISGIATTSCSWCSYNTPLAPGSTLSPSITMFGFSSISNATIGGQVQDPMTVALFASSINTGSFTLPAGGNSVFTFTVTLPASFSGQVQGSSAGFPMFFLNLPAGSLVLTFTFFPTIDGTPGAFYFTSGQYLAGSAAVPEPATIALIGTGLLGIAGLIRRKRRSR